RRAAVRCANRLYRLALRDRGPAFRHRRLHPAPGAVAAGAQRRLGQGHRRREPDAAPRPLKPAFTEITELARRIAARCEVGLPGDFVKMSESPPRRGKRDLLPGYFIPTEQADLYALHAGSDLRIEQACAIDELHLADARDRIDGEQAVDLDSRLRLLKGLAHGAFDRGLVQLQIARRQSPEAGTRV